MSPQAVAAATARSASKIRRFGAEPYRTLRVEKDPGGSAMPSAAYFRRQADICLRLAVIASDDEVSNRLIMMAREYATKGAALTRQSGGDALPADDRPVPAEPEAERDAALPNAADSAADH
jgi:hypothetical protein